MFTGLPSVLSFVLVSLTASQSDSLDLQLQRGETVSIEMTGEHAAEYVRIAHSESMPDSFRTNGVVTVTAVVRSVSTASLEVQHKVIVSETGQPIRRVTLDASINLRDLKNVLPPAEANADSSDLPSIKLTDSAKIKMRSSLVRGDFPEGRAVF